MVYYRIKNRVEFLIQKIDFVKIYHKDQLFTYVELKKLGIDPNWSNLEKVEIPRKKTYVSFFNGRFEE